ncbi:hypothetical protein T261_4604 [Streptomyces lydicus]|nr:hypothetical protein T261_4604 [Streptomyces lydicus]
MNSLGYLRYGLAGAAPAAPEAAWRITVGRGDRTAVAHPLPPDDPVPDGASPPCPPRARTAARTSGPPLGTQRRPAGV